MFSVFCHRRWWFVNVVLVTYRFRLCKTFSLKLQSILWTIYLRFRFSDIDITSNIHELIQNAAKIDLSWLNDLLCANGVITGNRVKSVEVLLLKRLQVSTVYRLSIEYTDVADSETRPSSLFLKLTGPDHGSDAQRDIGRSEADFYQNVAPRLGSPPLIKCLDAVYSPAGGTSHVLLEDLSPTHKQPLDPRPPSFVMSSRAVSTLATVHARFWNNPLLGNGVGTVFDNAWLRQFLHDLEKNVTHFLGFASDELSTVQRKTYERMLAVAPQIWGRLTNPNGLTVTHGDAHWWNFLYPKDPEKESVRIFDWQLWHIDLGARDLAFLLNFGGFAEPRPKLENHLKNVYFETLCANGVSGYSHSDFEEDYRQSVIRNLNLPVIFWTQGKSQNTWQSALRRVFSGPIPTIKSLFYNNSDFRIIQKCLPSMSIQPRSVASIKTKSWRWMSFPSNSDCLNRRSVTAYNDPEFNYVHNQAGEWNLIAMYCTIFT